MILVVKFMIECTLFQVLILQVRDIPFFISLDLKKVLITPVKSSIEHLSPTLWKMQVGHIVQFNRIETPLHQAYAFVRRQKAQQESRKSKLPLSTEEAGSEAGSRLPVERSLEV